MVYGWTNTRFFYIAPLLPRKPSYYCNYLYIQHFQQKLPDKFAKEKAEVLAQKVSLASAKAIRNIEDITAAAVSQGEEYLGVGLANGVTSVWTTNSLNILMNTARQKGHITQLAFFENWKLISGSSRGEVQVDNLLTLTNEVKRTNVFESKTDYPITAIRVSALGLAFALDANANLRAYDLWRNEKIARLYSCNSFAAQENKAKRWVAQAHPSLTLYTNNGNPHPTQISQWSFPPTGPATPRGKSPTAHSKPQKSTGCCSTPGNARAPTSTSSGTSSSSSPSLRAWRPSTKRATTAKR
jgi:hypothetical protein